MTNALRSPSTITISGGRPERSIDRLEEKFKCGICYEECAGKPMIRDIVILSITANFTTSEAGWTDIHQGQLMERPSGEVNHWHSALAEGYNLNEDCT
jgi:hypothetical protein